VLGEGWCVTSHRGPGRTASVEKRRSPWHYMAKLRLLDMHALPVRLVCYRSFTVGIKVSSILGRAADSYSVGESSVVHELRRIARCVVTSKRHGWWLMRMRHSLAAQRSGRGSHSRPDVRLPSQTQSATQSIYAKFRGRSCDAVIRVYDESGNVIETHEHKGDFKEW